MLLKGDIVYQPGSKSDNPAMPNDMVCHCLEGELQISQGPGKQFVAKTGDVWSCKKGMPEATENKGSTIAIMRVIDLSLRHNALKRFRVRPVPHARSHADFV